MINFGKVIVDQTKAGSETVNYEGSSKPTFTISSSKTTCTAVTTSITPILPVSQTLYFGENGRVVDANGDFYLTNQGYGVLGTTDANGVLTVNTLATITITPAIGNQTAGVAFNVAGTTDLPDGAEVEVFAGATSKGTAVVASGAFTKSVTIDDPANDVIIKVQDKLNANANDTEEIDVASAIGITISSPSAGTTVTYDTPLTVSGTVIGIADGSVISIYSRFGTGTVLLGTTTVVLGNFTVDVNVSSGWYEDGANLFIGAIYFGSITAWVAVNGSSEGTIIGDAVASFADITVTVENNESTMDAIASFADITVTVENNESTMDAVASFTDEEII